LQKVLIVGNGAREQAIAEALVGSPQEPGLYAFVKARNPGIMRIAEHVELGDTTNASDVTSYAKERGIDLAVVGPEAPLESGVVDELEESGVSCASPTSGAASIETSKLFARSIMDKYRVPGRNVWNVFDDPGAASDFIDENSEPVVVKPIGLTGGKGVKIVNPELTGQLKDLEEAKKYAGKVIGEGIGGHSSVLVERLLVGEEFTLQAFVDGKNVVPTPLVQDNKFAYEGDTGPFTGSMGSFSESNHILPFMTAMDFHKAMIIMEGVVRAMRKEGLNYRGALYGGFMLTSEGPKVLEFNARWGDPEAMNVLPIFQGDFLDACWAMSQGRLSELSPDFDMKATVCKYLAPEGYPTDPVRGQKIEIGDARDSGALIHFASVDERDGEIYMSSSRALACTGIADTMSEAERMAEEAISRVRGPVFYRKDIGTRALIDRRVAHMDSVRLG
jgi:phosphoribosylamine--glycine ligase